MTDDKPTLSTDDPGKCTLSFDSKSSEPFTLVTLTFNNPKAAKTFLDGAWLLIHCNFKILSDQPNQVVCDSRDYQALLEKCIKMQDNYWSVKENNSDQCFLYRGNAIVAEIIDTWRDPTKKYQLKFTDPKERQALLKHLWAKQITLSFNTEYLIAMEETAFEAFKASIEPASFCINSVLKLRDNSPFAYNYAHHIADTQYSASELINTHGWLLKPFPSSTSPSPSIGQTEPALNLKL